MFFRETFVKKVNSFVLVLNIALLKDKICHSLAGQSGDYSTECAFYESSTTLLRCLLDNVRYLCDEKMSCA